MCKVEIKRLYEDSMLPQKAYETDAGYDLYVYNAFKFKSYVEHTEPDQYDGWHMPPGSQRLVTTGIAIALPPGYEAQVRPRSGLALENGISITNSPGTIDSSYRNEIGVILLNTSKNGFYFKKGQRIAQLVIQKLPEITMVEVDELTPAPERGMAGYGSTGVK